MFYLEYLAQDVGCIFCKKGGGWISTDYWELESAVIDSKRYPNE